MLGKVSLQDLLGDEFARVAVALLRLGAVRRAPPSWQAVTSAVRTLRGVPPDDEAAGARAEADLTAFLEVLRGAMSATAPTAAAATAFADQVIEFMDQTAVRRNYPEYAANDLLDLVVQALRLHLAASADAAPTWAACLDRYEGLEQIPLMTVHKSKGLEYDTVVFVGLDDQAWWAHTPGDLEGLATFFVALSRAKQRAIFAFCEERGNRIKVAELYQLLTEAGVPEITI